MASLGVFEGIGMDDCFVLLAFWKKTSPRDSVPARLSQTYQAAAVSITITSVTNALSFLVGYTSRVYGAQLFSLYAGTAFEFSCNLAQ
jgi:hypothetical protein